jgi:ubiquinol-cytochrome c reductase cytochrome c1 subunit
MRDLTNFMVYLAEPAKLVRYKIGIWVMIFMGVLVFLTYATKKEYWRDVH